MSDPLISKILLTAFCIFVSLVWIGFIFFTSAMNGRHEWNFSFQEIFLMGVPTAFWCLVIWNTWT